MLSRDYCQIAVNIPSIQNVLTYKTLGEKLKTGTLVEIPLGRRKAKGVVVDFDVSEQDIRNIESKFELKCINSLFNENFFLSKSEYELFFWMSKYYHYNLGKLVWDSLPKILKRNHEVSLRLGKDDALEHELNPDQKFVFDEISKKLNRGFDKFYIHGVTGSGKTLIYLKLIKEVLKAGRSVLFLLPEINLTPQFTETFETFLNCPIFTYNSGVTPSYKNAVWKYVKINKSPFLVMGARSSVFLPMNNLGVIIVDEEHDGSFKQGDRCLYNGRDVAIKKAQIGKIPIILGSATPTLENYRNFSCLFSNKYFQLKKRASGNFPEVKLIDVRKKGRSPYRKDDVLCWPFEASALKEMRSALDKGEQVLVFVNRLGFANYVQCGACGHKFEDPNTGVPLRYFKNKNILSSSHSDYQIKLPEICPKCGNLNLLQKGFGTEKLQEILRGIFPDKQIERFDRDEITNLKELEKKLERFHRREIDVFVGTQMLSKGHNFKKVNLVLILGTDSMLNHPDFRSMEKAYQMLVQVLGRAGRYSKNAKVIIQTLLPDNPLFGFIKSHSFDGFYKFELAFRKEGNFPPYSKVAIITASGKNKNRLISELSDVASLLRQFSEKKSLDVDVWGPLAAMIERRVDKFSWFLILLSKELNNLHFLLNFFEKYNKLSTSFSVKIDVDPYTMS